MHVSRDDHCCRHHTNQLPDLIEEIGVLPRLYGRVIIPPAVSEELMSPRAPMKVQEWIRQPPSWMEVLSPTVTPDPKLLKLDAGERDAIILAEERSADQLIVDELFGRREAERRNLPVIGTIGVLREAAEMGLLDLRSAFAHLQRTSFHISPAILASLLDDSA